VLIDTDVVNGNIFAIKLEYKSVLKCRLSSLDERSGEGAMLRRRRYFLTPHATWLFIGNNTPKHLCGAGESFQFSPADKFGRRMSLVFSSVVYIRADQMYIISFNMKKAGKILLSFLFLVFRYLPSGVSFSY
jgi:hypothetical protein